MRGKPLGIRPHPQPAAQWLCAQAGERLSAYYADQPEAWAALVAEAEKTSGTPETDGRPDAKRQEISSEDE